MLAYNLASTKTVATKVVGIVTPIASAFRSVLVKSTVWLGGEGIARGSWHKSVPGGMPEKDILTTSS